VGDVMSGADKLLVTSPDEDVSAALERMAARGVEQLPVVADARLAGMLQRRDVLRWLELQSTGTPSLRRRQA